MKKIVLIAALSLLAGIVVAAPVALDAGSNTELDVLAEIESNNTTLHALRAQMEAEKAEAHTSLALPDPEVEFGYLWGSPTPAPGRKDIAVSQTLDFATIAGTRRNVARRQCEVASLEYRRARQEILLEAQQALINLQCADTILSLNRRRLAEAEELAAAWNRRLQHGQAEAIEVNKIAMAVALLAGEVQQAEVERNGYMAQLTTLNGGKPVIASTKATGESGGVLQVSFDEWYKQVAEDSPALQYAAAQERLAAQRLRLAKSENLPQLSIGYAGELVKGDNYQGVKFGLGVPLWGNRARIKAARAAHEAALASRQDAAVQFCGQLRAQFERTMGLLRVAQAYDTSASRHDNCALLQKALNEGHITLTDYLSETSLRHEIIVRVLEAWRDYRLSYAALQSITL